MREGVTPAAAGRGGAGRGGRQTERTRAIKAEERGDARHELTWPQDPLLEGLLRFENELELRGLVDRVFRLCDANATGRVDCTKMRRGLKALPYECAIHLAEEEYGRLAARYAPRRGAFGPRAFRRMLMHQLLLYCNRCLTRRHQLNSAAQQRVIFSSLKLLTLQVRSGGGGGARADEPGAARGPVPCGPASGAPRAGGPAARLSAGNRFDRQPASEWAAGGPPAAALRMLGCLAGSARQLPGGFLNGPISERAGPQVAGIAGQATRPAIGRAAG